MAPFGAEAACWTPEPRRETNDRPHSFCAPLELVIFQRGTHPSILSTAPGASSVDNALPYRSWTCRRQSRRRHRAKRVTRLDPPARAPWKVRARPLPRNRPPPQRHRRHHQHRHLPPTTYHRRHHHRHPTTTPSNLLLIWHCPLLLIAVRKHTAPPLPYPKRVRVEGACVALGIGSATRAPPPAASWNNGN